MSFGSLFLRTRYSKACSRICSPPEYRTRYFFHIALLSTYSGCSLLMVSMLCASSLQYPVRFLADLSLRPALPPDQIPQRIRQMCPAAVPLLIDLVAVFFVSNLFKVLDQLFTALMYRQQIGRA